MGLFVKIIMAVTAFIVVVTGIIIASAFFYPVSQAINETNTESNTASYISFAEWIFGASMVVLAGTPIIWYLYSVSSREYEQEEEWKRW